MHSSMQNNRPAEPCNGQRHAGHATHLAGSASVAHQAYPVVDVVDNEEVGLDNTPQR
jgi:hypothetical protein